MGTSAQEHPLRPLRIPYEAMKFEWVCSHYDVHLEGTCRVNGELMRFRTVYNGRPGQSIKCTVFPLSSMDKFCWKFHQKAFELCVGRHCTYPQAEKVWFHLKRPEWFWGAVKSLYYHFTMPID